VLRIASQEYVAGHPIIAGKLAKTVDFEVEQDVLDEAKKAEPPAEPVEGVDVSPEVLAAQQAREEQCEWVRLRDFLVGAGGVAQAKQENDLRERRSLFYEAIPYLEASQREGFPAGRQTDGNRLLGESLFSVGKYDQAVEFLQIALQRDPTLARDTLPMLAESQLHAAAPLAADSLQSIDRFLDDKTLQLQQRWAGELIRIRVLAKLNRWPDVSDAVERAAAIPRATDLKLLQHESNFRNEVELLRAVATIQEAIERFGKQPADEFDDRSEAVSALKDTLAALVNLEREASPTISVQAKLWAARAYVVQGEFDEALTRLTAVRQQRPFGAEAIVGGLEEVELLAQDGHGVEVLQSVRYLIRELGDPKGFDARLITFEEFQRRLAGVLEQLRRAGEYDKAIDTARSLPPVINKAEALIQEGMAYREWAAATIKDGSDINGQVSRGASVLARSRYRAAGDAFAEAAQLQFDTEEFIPTQWSAIDSYQQGRHFSQSVRLLEPYLRYEERAKQPRGLLAYGRALLAEGNTQQAIQSLTDCILEFPRDPNKYPARLMLAAAYAETGDLENAKRLLNDNLLDEVLTPQSPSWRDSLFLMGELLYEHGERNLQLAEKEPDEAAKMEKFRANQVLLEEAIQVLEEAQERYWPQPRAESAAYMSSRAHVLASRWPRIEANTPGILDAARRSLRTQADQKLQVALEGFADLRKHLNGREEEARLPESQQKMLRNCYIAEADVLREMNRLEDAAAAYRSMELRYMNEPPALEALLGRASCLRSLGLNEQADKLIRQASVVLQRIPPEMDEHFATTTRYDRQQWESLLGWMNQRLDNGGA
jgi:tetratricopeptide (TPR) repeat protein